MMYKNIIIVKHYNTLMLYIATIGDVLCAFACSLNILLLYILHSYLSKLIHSVGLKQRRLLAHQRETFPRRRE